MLRLPADSDRVSRFAALAVCAVAVALCAWLLVRLIWLLVPRSAEVAPVAPAATAASAQSAATSIAQWHLFGNPQNVDLAARARSAPKTTLELVLRGTFALSDPKQGIAIIADGPRGERSYNVGDAVGSATLAEVYADHVVLSHDGAEESLSLPRPEDHAPDATASNTNSRQPGQASSMPPGYTPGRPAPFQAPAANGASPALARASAADLARDVRFEPVFDGGHIAGARLSGSGAAAALMNQVGLRPTDVVTAVNGTQLANVANPQQLIEQLGNASSLQVTIQRDGRPATLTLNLR
jgi:general secretion pathway protein C